jgi:S-adenosylmethionine:tRNA ribosyltransferase-isomerase
MPSAGRPFRWKLLFELKRNGMAYISLHAGLSSYMDSDLDQRHISSEEEYFVGSTIVEQVNKIHSLGGRVIAVGTTVVRVRDRGSRQ